MSQYTYFPPSIIGAVNIPGVVSISNFPNPQPVTISSIPLPVGASTSSNQTSGDQKTQIVDELGNVIGSTSNALDVNIASGVTLTVDLDNSTDNVLVYGFDGAVNRPIKTDASGELQVDVLSSSLPSGASTSALQISGNASLTSIDSKLTSPLAVTGPLTDAELRATPVPVSGTVTANAGTGVFAVIGPLTDAELRATPVPVSGAFFQATQPVSGTVAATQSGVWTVGLSAGANDIGSVHVLTMPVVQVEDNGGSLTVDGVFFQAVQPVSGAFFQATQPVSGTVTANQGSPNTIANRWPVQGTDGTNSQIYTATGAALVDGSAVTQPVSAVSLPLPAGASTSALQTTGNTSLSSIDTNLNDVIAVDGTALPAQTLIVAGTDGTNIQSLSVDATGKLNINNISGVVSLPTGAATEATLALLPVSQGGATTGESGVLAMGSVTTSEPVYTTGQTSPLSLNTSGRLRTADNGEYVHISTATTVTVKSGLGILKSVVLNTRNAGSDAMTIYDNTAGSGAVIAVISPGANGYGGTSMIYNLKFSTGLTVVTTGASDWTVVYQ